VEVCSCWAPEASPATPSRLQRSFGGGQQLGWLLAESNAEAPTGGVASIVASMGFLLGIFQQGSYFAGGFVFVLMR